MSETPTQNPYLIQTNPVENTTVQFFKDSVQVGCFDFGVSPVTFTGDVDESARIFVDYVISKVQTELTAARQELKAVTEQRDRLAEACSPSFDTTETDAAWSAHCIDPDSASGDPWDLAKKLETELAAVTEQLKEAQDGWHDEITKGLSELKRAESIYTKAQERAERAEEQRDRLAEACKLLMAIVGEPNSSVDSCWASEDEMDAAWNMGNEALAAVKGGSHES